MKKNTLVFILLTMVLFGSMSAQSAGEDGLNPLNDFAPLVGGEWHLEGSYQVFEWGVGKKSIRSSSYFLVDGEKKVVAEGYWFWHPGEKQIKGYCP